MELLGKEVKASSIFYTATIVTMATAVGYGVGLLSSEVAITVALVGVSVVLLVEGVYTQSIEEDIQFRELAAKLEDEVK